MATVKDPHSSASQAPVRILLVDDDRLILASMSQGLRAAGYLVDEAADGEEALALARLAVHDLAIVDIRLPDISGIELARRLREEMGLPSLFFSAYDEPDMVREAVAEGGLGYLVKPVNPRTLPATIEAAVARARDLRVLLEIKGRLEQALETGRDTSTAVGILMERKQLGREEAFQNLRAAARSQRRSVESLAGKLVKAVETLNTLKDHDDGSRC